MPNPPSRKPRNASAGRQIWTALNQVTEAHEHPTVYVLTDDDFHCVQFKHEADQEKALRRIRDGDDPATLAGWENITIALDSIVRVERLPGEKWFYIQSERRGRTRWQCIRCPSLVAGKIFQALRKRLRPALRASKERQSVWAAATTPLGYLGAVWFITLFIWLGALAAAKPESPSDPEWEFKTVHGAKMIGGFLGPTVVLALGGLVSLGTAVWGAFVIAQRPMQSVLRPAAEGDRSDQDDWEQDEEPEQAERPPRKERTVLILGSAALVLGVPALALGWHTAVRLPLLVAAGIGLSLAAGGVVASLSRSRRIPVLPIAGGAVNLLAVVVVFVLLLAPARKPAGENGPAAVMPRGNGPATVVPEGNGPAAAEPGRNEPVPMVRGATLADWGEPLDPDGDCSIAVRGGALVIDVPATPHGLNDEVGGGNAPRVLRDVDGDFSVQVKVAGTLHPQARASVPGRLAFQAGGLLLWSDKDNYIRFVRSGQNRNGAFNPVVAFTRRTNAQPGRGQTLPVPEQDLYLRLERRGNRILGSFSPNGQQWTSLQTLDGTFPARLRIGVMALNAAQQPLSVRFEEFKVGR